MAEARVKESIARCVTVSHINGHEFDFEAIVVEESKAARLYAERWKNRRLPLDAILCRQAARVVAEQRLREHGLI